MQFKIDENLPVEVAELLVDAGHDAKTVNEQQPQGTKDTLLIDICKSENRVLVSLDTDFSNITTYATRDFSGIIVFKVGSQIDFLVVMKGAHQTHPKRVKEIMPLLASIREAEAYRRLEGFALNLEPSFLLVAVGEVMRHPPLLIEVSQEGKILFDRDDFPKQELNKVRMIMERLGSVRKEISHGHYWVSKPGPKSDQVVEL